LDHPTFQGLFEQHPSVAKAVLASLSQQLAQGGAVVAKLLSRDFDPRYRVVVFDTKSYTETVFRERNRHDYLLQFIEARLSVETAALAAGAKVVCAFVNDTLDEAVLAELRGAGVELVAMRCAGYNNVDLAACQRLGITVLRVPAYSPHAVAEHTIALMLTLNRRVHRAHNRVREGNFSLDGLVGFDFYGKAAGIVGTGKIGKCVVEILAGFGCRLLAHDRYPDPAFAERHGLRYVALDEIFTESDVITLHTPLVPETKHLINAAAIAKMKPGVMIINTSRGALIDTQALLAGLKRGQIGYAGLDVYEEESDYFFEDYSDRVMTDDLLARLTTFNNVVVTSHQAFLTREALTNIADTTLENIREYQVGRRGDQLTNLVRVD
jgi:D-lactate dehydrogenase